MGPVDHRFYDLNILTDGTVSLEDKRADDQDSDDDLLDFFPEDYMVDQHKVPDIEDLDEALVPILAHKDSRKSILNIKKSK